MQARNTEIASIVHHSCSYSNFSLFLRIEEFTQYNKMNVYTLSLSFGTQFARCFPNIVKNYATYVYKITFSPYSIFPNTIVFGMPFSCALQRCAPSKVPAPLLVSMRFIEESGFGTRPLFSSSFSKGVANKGFI